MTDFSNFARQAAAVFGAAAMTAFLLVSSFATSPAVALTQGVIA